MDKGTIKPGRNGKRDFLLHVCCAPCSPHPVEVLKKDYRLTLYFYNPNIYPQSEYEKRLGEVEKFSALENLPLLKGDYRPDAWTQKTLKYKNEPEKGKRCDICIGERLLETARMAARLGMENFGAVLSVSPHKDALAINRLGRETQAELESDGLKITFFEADWKKKNGFKISSRISKERGFAQQDYCGCTYSLKERNRRAIARVNVSAQTKPIDGEKYVR